MKSVIRELIADFKAAVRIGHPESIQVALDGYCALPEIAGNAALSQAFLEQVSLPLGEVLAFPRLDVEQLYSLLDDPSAGVRALGAVALGVRFLTGQGVAADDLQRPGRDQRAEVRVALGETLARHAVQNPQRLLALVAEWIGNGAEVGGSWRLRHSGLIALRGLIPDYCDQVVPMLAALPKENDRETRGAHVDTLVSLAEKSGRQSVYEILESWAAEEEPDTWMIAKTLSSAWAAGDLNRSEKILQALERRVGEHQAIERAKRALSRHGTAASAAGIGDL
jgi:hypothetical protein